ncbi:uncharacterized protein LOC127739287 isoform X2 [Mytilus californianus]|uniref:uncharacterized protein LOC127739287 isoform X2 n=1 Tax=Mytilus californianus TaxID=6549 RepID=UPI002246A082|nr:uncharacterized protein LOC127739287 isoform X2 [Mytilus californianus]
MFTRMDVIQSVLGIYSLTLLIRGCASSLVIDIRPKNGIWDTAERPCAKKCKYGYEADVEGNTMCQCLDPCAHIYCPFEGTKCVVRRTDQFCVHGQCKYEATCRTVSNQRRKKLQKLNRYRLNKYKNEVYYELQRDSSDTSVTNLCSRQPSINSRYSCDRKQKGYYYDGLKDACVRFKGCHQTGDFFGRRKDCKRSCMKKDNSIELHSLKIRNKICTLTPPDSTQCTRQRRVWHFDSRKGRCVKSRGCHYTGNSFKRRSQCKNTCNRRKSKKQQRKQRIRFVS